MQRHPFLTWLLSHYGAADTPRGDLARELKGAHGVPTSGNLRPWLEREVRWDSWMLREYDKAWAEFTAPRCLTPGCTYKAAGGASSYCPAHGGRSHHAAGSA